MVREVDFIFDVWLFRIVFNKILWNEFIVFNVYLGKCDNEM